VATALRDSGLAGSAGVPASGADVGFAGVAVVVAEDVGIAAENVSVSMFSSI